MCTIFPFIFAEKTKIFFGSRFFPLRNKNADIIGDSFGRVYFLRSSLKKFSQFHIWSTLTLQIISQSRVYIKKVESNLPMRANNQHADDAKPARYRIIFDEMKNKIEIFPEKSGRRVPLICVCSDSIVMMSSNKIVSIRGMFAVN